MPTQLFCQVDPSFLCQVSQLVHPTQLVYFARPPDSKGSEFPVMVLVEVLPRRLRFKSLSVKSKKKSKPLQCLQLQFQRTSKRFKKAKSCQISNVSGEYSFFKHLLFPSFVYAGLLDQLWLPAYRTAFIRSKLGEVLQSIWL